MRTICFRPSPPRGRPICVRIWCGASCPGKVARSSLPAPNRSLDDLVQVASLGLVKSIDGFDPSLGSRSRPTPRRRSSAAPTPFPRSRLEPSAAARPGATTGIDRADGALAEELGRHPTPTEIAARLRHGRGRAASRGHSARSTRSLDSQFAGGGVADLGRDAWRNGPGYDRVEAEAAAARGRSSTTASGECCACGSSTR